MHAETPAVHCWTAKSYVLGCFLSYCRNRLCQDRQRAQHRRRLLASSAYEAGKVSWCGRQLAVTRLQFASEAASSSVVRHRAEIVRLFVSRFADVVVPMPISHRYATTQIAL
jgi:hypothetical protein